MLTIDGKLRAEIIDALTEVEEYLDQRADAAADEDSYGAIRPNREMVLLTAVSGILDRISGPRLWK